MTIINTEPEEIQQINIASFTDYILPGSRDAFFGKCGKEHFRLLAYLSTQFHNTNIINIRTNGGYEALALSHNETNTVFSFGPTDQLANTTIEDRPNIHFITEDILDTQFQLKWRQTILSSAFIFVDIEPHNGTVEHDLYLYLSDIGYRGFVIYDDIWYFKSMRNQLWYKIPESQRFDLTEVGHWSGTGIVNFNENIQFDKRDNSHWTLVTAYFNLTKCPDASPEICARDKNYYFSHAISTLSMPYNLVIYCDPESLPQIQQIRPTWFADKTRYVVREFDDLGFCKNDEPLPRRFRDYREKIIQNRREKPYHFDNRNTASYYLFCMARYAMLKETIEANPFGSTHFAWINFCIERMGYQNLIRLDEALAVNRDRFSTCYIDYIPETLVKDTAEYFKFGRCSMCSGFFTGNGYYMHKVCDLVETKFLEYLYQGYGHADEQLFSPVYFENPHLFEHYYGDYLQMITNYKYIYDNPEAPVYNFIKNSFDNHNFAKCLEGCRFLRRSIDLGKCNLSQDYMGYLGYYTDVARQNIHYVHPT